MIFYSIFFVLLIYQNGLYYEQFDAEKFNFRMDANKKPNKLVNSQIG